MHYPLEQIHPLALAASEAAECAARQGRFWEMHGRLFDGPNALAASSLVQHAQALGINQTEFTECLTRHVTLERIHADQTEGQRLGVRATPSFFIGIVRSDGGIDLARRIRGALTAERFTQLLADFSAGVS
jgi:protein-disulfide isomerase